MVCRLNQVGSQDSPLSTLVQEGVTVNITSCCNGQFERRISIGMSCQEINTPDILPGIYTHYINVYHFNCLFMAANQYFVFISASGVSLLS